MQASKLVQGERNPAGNGLGQHEMVGPNGLEPSTSSVSRKRSNQTELRAYMRMAAVQFYRASSDSGNESHSSSSDSASMPMFFSPAAFFSQYFFTQASKLLPAAVSLPVNERAAMSL